MNNLSTFVSFEAPFLEYHRIKACSLIRSPKKKNYRQHTVTQHPQASSGFARIVPETNVMEIMRSALTAECDSAVKEGIARLVEMNTKTQFPQYN